MSTSATPLHDNTGVLVPDESPGTTLIISYHILITQEDELRFLLRPCVGQVELLDGEADLLRARLVAVLQYTAMEGRITIDLYDRCARPHFSRS